MPGDNALALAVSLGRTTPTMCTSIPSATLAAIKSVSPDISVHMPVSSFLRYASAGDSTLNVVDSASS